MLDEFARDLQKVAVDGRVQSLKNELYTVERKELQGLVSYVFFPSPYASGRPC